MFRILKQPSRKLLDRVRDVARRKHYSIRTEGAYINWIKRYILLHDKRHPKEKGVPSSFLYTDPRSDVVRRNHVHENSRGSKSASLRILSVTALLPIYWKRVTILRKFFTTFRINFGQVYTHVLNKGPIAVRSPLDELNQV